MAGSSEGNQSGLAAIVSVGLCIVWALYSLYFFAVLFG